MKNQIKRAITKCLSFVLEAIFPRFCVNCGEEGSYICEECSFFISEAGFLCPICGNSSYFGEKHKKCREANGLDGLINLWDYDGSIKKAIHNIKYDKTFHILEEMVERFLLTAEKDRKRFSLFFSFLLDEETHITFVPIHSKKERERGFNQSENLANYIAKISGKRVVKLLKKEKETRSQTGLNKKERAINVKDAFSFILPKDKIVRKVMIIDDVWTSGATMKECCRVIKMNGVKKVWGFTLARS